MMREEVQRLAAAVHQLRPDWPVRSLQTFIETRLPERSYTAAAVAFAVIATDPTTSTPARILESGPWWQNTYGGGPLRPYPPLREESCTVCGQPERRCRQIAALPDDGHEFAPHVPRDAADVDQTTGELIELPANTDLARQAREGIYRRDQSA